MVTAHISLQAFRPKLSFGLIANNVSEMWQEEYN